MYRFTKRIQLAVERQFKLAELRERPLVIEEVTVVSKPNGQCLNMAAHKRPRR